MSTQEQKSPHILNASSNLLGICFVVLTSLRVLKIAEKSLIDEFTTAAIILFMASCILSFLSIRGSIKNESKLENIADFFFLAGISLLFITTLLFSFNIIQ